MEDRMNGHSDHMNGKRPRADDANGHAGSGAAKFGEREYTEATKNAIKEKLLTNVSPEDIAQRPGPGAKQLSYIEHHKAVQIANEIFGHTSWSCDLKNVQIQFQTERNGKWDVGVSAVMAIELENGCKHVDIGWGDCTGSRRSDALEKAMKQAVSDARKRALRIFGNGAGLCCYDKDFLQEVKKQKTERPVRRQIIPPNSPAQPQNGVGPAGGGNAPPQRPSSHHQEAQNGASRGPQQNIRKHSSNGSNQPPQVSSSSNDVNHGPPRARQQQLLQQQQQQKPKGNHQMNNQNRNPNKQRNQSNHPAHQPRKPAAPQTNAPVDLYSTPNSANGQSANGNAKPVADQESQQIIASTFDNDDDDDDLMAAMANFEQRGKVANVVSFRAI